ncbi:hypothetical protein BGW39_006462 [Mortierella sp. 14UC]|nr:hypothetical protein BGW39_006462 [Mortierella sp. 14UC]
MWFLGSWLKKLRAAVMHDILDMLPEGIETNKPKKVATEAATNELMNAMFSQMASRSSRLLLHVPAGRRRGRSCRDSQGGLEECNRTILEELSQDEEGLRVGQLVDIALEDYLNCSTLKQARTLSNEGPSHFPA